MTAIARPRALAQPVADILIQSPLWSAEPGAQDVVRAVVDASAQEVNVPEGAELSILLSDDATIRLLNRTWRGEDRPTNVLSFPASGPRPGDGFPLGDIVLAYETLRQEALDAAMPFTHRLAHLTVHGLLHLLGYDHDCDAAAEAMEAAERAVLARLAIPDPYGTEMPDHDA